MKKLVTPRKSEFERLQFARWVLFLVVTARAAGMRELNRERLHALLFQSFASSLFYGIRPLRQRAQRTKHGAYYRAAHIALGRLVLGGLVELDEFDPLDPERGLQFNGRLAPTPAGLTVVAKLRETMHGEQIYRFLLDLCLSMVRAVSVDSTPDEALIHARPAAIDPLQAEQHDITAQQSIDRVLHTDLSYQKAAEEQQTLLPVVSGPDDVPLTVRGLRDVATALDDGGVRNSRDVLTAYQFLLRRRAA